MICNHMIFDHTFTSRKFVWQQANSRIALKLPRGQKYLPIIYRKLCYDVKYSCSVGLLTVSDEKVASNESSTERKLDVQKLMTICSANFLKGQKKRNHTRTIEKATKKSKDQD